MAQINPYLNFQGNTEEVFNFYKSIFGNDFIMIQRFADTPDHKVPDDEKNMLMHISLPVGQNVLMGSDSLKSMGHEVKVGNNFSLSVTADSKEEADKIFNGLSDGGNITMPLQDTFWGAYFGMCIDKYGIQWMVNYDYPRN